MQTAVDDDMLAAGVGAVSRCVGAGVGAVLRCVGAGVGAELGCSLEDEVCFPVEAVIEAVEAFGVVEPANKTVELII